VIRVPLTPSDVANKQFKIAFRGYALDEVDAFLDEVETEISRLLRDNAALKGGAGAPVPPAARPTASPAAAPASAPQPAPAPPAAPAPPVGLEGQEAALRTLLLAQRTADEAIAEARAEAEQLVGGARAEAESTLGKARQEAETTLTSARQEAETTLTSARKQAETMVGSARAEAERTVTAARKEADSTLTASKDRASRLDQEVAARFQATLGDLDARRQALESRIEQLRAFEREYRTRLKAYLEGQLRELDSSSGADGGGAGVPAGARTAAVGPGVAARPAVQAAPAQTAPASPAPAAAPAAAPGGQVRAVASGADAGRAPVGPFRVVPADGSSEPGAEGATGAPPPDGR